MFKLANGGQYNIYLEYYIAKYALLVIKFNNHLWSHYAELQFSERKLASTGKNKIVKIVHALTQFRYLKYNRFTF